MFRDKDLDVGFILRANTDVAAILHAAIKEKPTEDGRPASEKMQDFGLTLLDQNKRCYGLSIDNKLYLCSLIDLPCIIEAMKTLDYNTFYKSCDASQMMYVHNVFFENHAQRSVEELQKFVADFNPLDDEEFKKDLY